jgi:hypothetical protein
MSIESGLVGDSILSRAAYGGGYGYGNGYHGGREFANDGSNAVRINRNEKVAAQAHDFLSKQISDNADRNRDLAQLQNDNAKEISNRDFQTQIGFNLANQVARGEDNQNANFNMLAREAAANAREAAKCCCEAKLLAVQNQAKTDASLATILANQECASKVSDAVASATQNAKLDLLLSERGGRGNSGN